MVVPLENRACIIGNECSWKIQREFRENDGLASLGLLQNLLSNKLTKSCLLDFQHVEWADPQPLLCLGLVLAQSDIDKTQITINLGNTDPKGSTPNHRIFLKFLAQQGFLTALGDQVRFLCEGRIIEKQSDLQELRWRLAAEPQATHFLNADCIFARILESSQFCENEILLQETVEDLVKEAHERAIESAFGAMPLARDVLFQKLRKLLFELLLNVAEHSHVKGMNAYAGVYARIRGPKPPIDAHASTWKSHFNWTIRTFGQSQFNPNQYAEWLELYVCDVGKGLTSEIENWQIPAGQEDLLNDLKAAQKSKNPLESIASRLFRYPLSRHLRHDSNRTSVTGLQHLGHLLGIGGDYCRIYTQNGCWVGGHLPWNPSYSRKDIRDPEKTPMYASFCPVSGTAYVFSIQPIHNNISSYNRYWVTADEDARAKILATLSINKGDTTQNVKNIAPYDRRTNKDCSPPSANEPAIERADVVILRPPRLISKQDIAKWLAMVVGRKGERPITPVNIFVIADLTPFQTLTLRELLLHIDIYEQTHLDLYLVTEHWAVVAMTTLAGASKFSLNENLATSFLQTAYADESFTISDLAVSLRKMDSQIFWQSPHNQGVNLPFYNAPVDWQVSRENDKRIRLQRYLDFPHALADPERYRACRRALRRCLALFPGYKPVPADDLVDSLVKDVTLSLYTGLVDTIENKTIVVGSVAVTAGTTNQIREQNGSESMHIMVHSDGSAFDHASCLSALLWIPDESDFKNVTYLAKTAHWRRIPNTPYIAPLGEQSISILRYKRKNGRLDFEEPLYERTPEQTYKDFLRLGILKNGHWKYGSRHDLLTINMRLAFRSSFMELGPLYIWMKHQFKELFKAEDKHSAKAQLLIYPSHPVTDTMLDRIRQDAGFKDILPEGGMIPVKFLGMRTVSPLLASHLVAYRIEKLVAEHNEWKEWSVVIIDDGVVSGKHMRELIQFLRGLKAKTVYTIALLDRTGLPVQEKLVEKFLENNRRFWRWDVPDLGNARDCPLCQAISIAQTYVNKLPFEEQKKRLQEWIEIWRAQDVDNGWQQGGLKQTPLAEPLSITFGVDEDVEGGRREKGIELNNSTAITSMLLELTRLTTRADVALKKSAKIENTYPDASIEIIASQLLLFIDELSPHNKLEMYVKLLDLIWTRPFTTPAMSLGGLCFTLIDHKILGKIWKYCKNELLKNKPLINHDAILATYILYSRYFFKTKEEYRLSVSEEISEIESENYNLLGIGRELRSHKVRKSIRNFLIYICTNPSTHGDICIHKTEIRERLNKLVDCKEEIDYQLKSAVLEDLGQIIKVLSELSEEGIVKFIEGDISVLKESLNDLKSAFAEPSSCIHHQYISNKIIKLLYGEGDTPGIVHKTADQFLHELKCPDDIDNKFINQMVKSLRNDWDDTVSKNEIRYSKLDCDKRWKKIDGKVIKPEIVFSSSESLPYLWLYCDLYIRNVLKDVFLNVYHVAHEKSDHITGDEDNALEDTSTHGPVMIPDPWGKFQRTFEAHMWWEVKTEGDYAIFTIANATEDQDIHLGPKSTIAMLELVGGGIDVNVAENIAYTSIRIPLHSAFIKEDL